MTLQTVGDPARLRNDKNCATVNKAYVYVLISLWQSENAACIEIRSCDEENKTLRKAKLDQVTTN
jgi:hypothetical protein